MKKISTGVGAIVVSPTRELAMQTFEVLKLVAANHKLHGGLMIGRGMDLQAERRDAATYSIIIATPGRLLQHLDEAYDLKVCKQNRNGKKTDCFVVVRLICCK